MPMLITIAKSEMTTVVLDIVVKLVETIFSLLLTKNIAHNLVFPGSKKNWDWYYKYSIITRVSTHLQVINKIYYNSTKANVDNLLQHIVFKEIKNEDQWSFLTKCLKLQLSTILQFKIKNIKAYATYVLI